MLSLTEINEEAVFPRSGFKDFLLAAVRNHTQACNSGHHNRVHQCKGILTWILSDIKRSGSSCASNILAETIDEAKNILLNLDRL